MSFSNKYGNEPTLLNYIKTNTTSSGGGGEIGATGPTGPQGNTGDSGSFDMKEYTLFSTASNKKQKPIQYQNLTFFAPNQGYNTVSISSSGQYQITSGFGGDTSSYNLSTDYGNTWSGNLTLPNQKLRGCKISGTGQFITLVGINWTDPYSVNQPASIIRSDNFGSSFSIASTSLLVNWNSVSMSFSGQYQTATSDDKLYRSEDYGLSWSEVSNSTSHQWKSVAVSNSGKYQYACCPNHIYVSTNYGIDWTEIVSIPGKNWLAVSIDGTGRYIYLLNSDQDYIYMSDNFGETWNSFGYYLYWQSINVSETGQYVIAIQNGLRYWSDNYGALFLTIDNNYSSFVSCAVNSSGEYHICLRNGNGFSNTDDGNCNIYPSLNYIQLPNTNSFSLNTGFPAISFNEGNTCKLLMGSTYGTDELISCQQYKKFGINPFNQYPIVISTDGYDHGRIYFGNTSGDNYIKFNQFANRYEFYVNGGMVGSIP